MMFYPNQYAYIDIKILLGRAFNNPYPYQYGCTDIDLVPYWASKGDKKKASLKQYEKENL